MAFPILAYIPYAAVGYCVAHMAKDVWPTMRSQLATVTHHSSRHGMDGEAYAGYERQADCPPGSTIQYGTAYAARNQAQPLQTSVAYHGQPIAGYGNLVDTGYPNACYAQPPRGGPPIPMRRGECGPLGTDPVLRANRARRRASRFGRRRRR